MVDYVRLAATAKRLIDKNGRAISIVKLERDPVDGAKPWRGDPSPRDTGQPEATATTIGVFVEPGSIKHWGFMEISEELIGRWEQVVMVSGNGVNQVDLEEYDEVVDGTIRWRIQNVIKLKPADLTMIYALGLSR